MTPRQKAGRLSKKADPMKESPSPNTTLSHYLILSQLGAGGMGDQAAKKLRADAIKFDFIIAIEGGR